MSRLFAIIIGCNYADTGRPNVPPLRAAEEDARHLSAFLSSTPFVNGELAMMQLLLGREASTLNIRRAIQQTIAAQSPDDTLLLYFAGHGLKTENGLVLYTWDSDLQARDLLEAFGTNIGPVRLVLDCCHAGAIEPSGDSASA